MDKIKDSIKFRMNQNLGGMLISFGFLGASEHYNLCTLYWFSLIPCIATVVSLCFTTWAYTSKYVHSKNNSHD